MFGTRGVLLVGLVSMLALAVLLPSGLADRPGLGTMVTVSGSGTIVGCINPDPTACANPPAAFSINAVSLPVQGGGAVAHGTYTFRTITGDVECVAFNAEEGLASVGGTVTDSPSEPDIVGQHFLVFILDSLTLGTGSSRPDINPEGDTQGLLPADFPETCPTPTALVVPGALYGLLSGSVAVESREHPLIPAH